MTYDLIETYELTKIYKLKKQKDIKALDKVSLKIKEGEIFGLLGPNGAGKTTLVNILTTLLQPTQGYALIDGINILKQPQKARKKFGLMLGAKMIYNRITGYDNLKFFGKIYDIKNYHERIIDLAKKFELENWLNQYVESYSMGMKTKLAICRSLLIDPPILFLDEPTLGLDVASRALIVDQIKKMNKTILLTSHNMHVVEKLCDHIAFINKGKIIKIGTQEELVNLMLLEINIDIGIINNRKDLKSELKNQNFVSKCVEGNKGLTITIKERDYYNNLIPILSKYKINKIREQEPSLDNLFVKINQ